MNEGVSSPGDARGNNIISTFLAWGKSLKWIKSEMFVFVSI